MHCVLTCSRAHVSYVATCSLAHVSCALTCSRANVPYVLTCSRANVSCVLSFSRANVSCVLICSRANFTRVSTSLHALTSNNKKKFQWHILIFEIKLHIKSAWAGNSLETSILRIQLYIPAFSLTRRKPLTGAMTNFL